MFRLWRCYKAHVALFLIAFFLSCPSGAVPRDAQEIGDWLCSKIFAGGDATLVFLPDGFFALRLAPQGKSVQNVTGLWRLEPDGVGLFLDTLQDARIRLSVGNGAIYALFGQNGHVTLLPVRRDKEKFRITGILTKRDNVPIITDAGSGKDFEVIAESGAQEGKFATAEIVLGGGKIGPAKLIRHSGTVPKLLDQVSAANSAGNFVRDAIGKFWLIPANLWREPAALRFSPPERDEADENQSGDYEISGPGLRLEGKYQLAGKKLTLKPDAGNLQNLKIIGAGELGAALAGEFSWRLTSRGLELTGSRGRYLFLSHQY